MKAGILFLFFLLPLAVTSQNKSKLNLKVKGTVIDSATQKSIPFATISLYKMPSDQVFKRLASDADGSFVIQMTDTGNYKITVQMTGYALYSKHFTLTDSARSIDIGQIVIAEAAETLKEVSIVADKPLVKVDADKIAYSTESDPESKTSNVLDIMRKVPLITVDGDDNIQLKGASNFKIFINGKPSTMLSNNPKDVLKSMPASTVKDIEVITSPGAKYDAEGIGGIINIITMKKTVNGYTCSINAGASTRKDMNSNIYFATSLGKFAFSTNASIYYYNPPNNRSETYRENYNIDAYKYTYYKGKSNYIGLSPWGNGEASYEIDTLNLISASFNFWLGRPHGTTNTDVSIYDAGNQPVQEYLMKNSFDNQYGSPEGNIDYQHTFKKNKEQIFTLSYKINHSPDNNSGQTEYEPILNYFPLLRKSSTEAATLEQTFQADYVQPFSKGHALEFGGKYILRDNNSFSQYFLFDYNLGDFVEENQSSDFDYSQKILGAYSSLKLKFDKFSIKTGIRMENCITNGSISSQDTSFTNESLEFVPNVNLSYQISPVQNIKLAYNMRIQRPNIWYLNPYINNLDNKNIRFGNPDLDPEQYHNIEFSYGRFGKSSNLNLTTFYSFSNNSIENYSWVVDTVTYNSYYNLGKFWSAGMSVYGSLRFGTKFSINIGGSARYTDIESTMESTLKSNGWGGNANSSLQYSFKKGFRLSVYGGFYYRGAYLQRKSSPYYYNGLSLNKSFLKEKLTISLATRNPFQKEIKFVSETTDPDFYIKNTYIQPARSFNLNIRFKFGEMNGAVKKTKTGINNDDVKAGQGGNSGGDGGGK